MSRRSDRKEEIFAEAGKYARALVPHQWITITELALEGASARIVKSEQEIARHNAFPADDIPVDDVYSLEPRTREQIIQTHQERKAHLIGCVRFLVAAKSLLLHLDAERIASFINFDSFNMRKR